MKIDRLPNKPLEHTRPVIIATPVNNPRSPIPTRAHALPDDVTECERRVDGEDGG